MRSIRFEIPKIKIDEQKNGIAMNLDRAEWIGVVESSQVLQIWSTSIGVSDDNQGSTVIKTARLEPLMEAAVALPSRFNLGVSGHMAFLWLERTRWNSVSSTDTYQKN
ncbi:unnamed protein product [Dovyalis caffra]|uniref:Uncharacterized protein n=1 Tax=Dovyalis caffra TaxID=77055 RepID=A0AAV1SQU7_9ROSI|nr:unnamed protein product [Dovyalis caffra]